MKYIAYYDIPEYAYENRSINLAGANVMEYMAEIASKYVPIEIISPSRSLAKKGFFKSRKKKIKENISLRLPFTFGTKTKLGRLISIMLVQIWLLKILLFETGKNEKIWVYHSLALIPILKLISKIKKLDFIFEIREIYSDVDVKMNRSRELKFFNLGNKYIFATSILNKIINSSVKPYLIAPGIYKNFKNSMVSKWDDGKIHLVYAGNLTPQKGGAEISVRIAEFLSPEYVIHILGSGAPEIEARLMDLINLMNEKNQAKVIFEGSFRGDEFNKFLQKCDIGLSTQNPLGNFNNTSFPSKILTYLGNGLEVISANIPAVTECTVGRFIHYYYQYAPSNIAKEILKIRQKLNNPEVLYKLDNELSAKIKELIGHTNHEIKQ